MTRILLSLSLSSLILWLTGCAQTTLPLSLDKEQHISKLVDQGTLYLRQGELERAESSFKVADEIGRSPAATDGLGCVAFLRGEYEKAYLYFVAAYKADNTYFQALANLALLYDILGDKGSAQMVYERALDEVPENFRMRNNYAALMIESNADEFAKTELMKAAAIVPHPLVEENLRNLP